jgi:uncharacterized lipoprotein YddW (UPF0748 family)
VFSQSPKREMRGVWIATVANIDWPSSKGLTVEQQKKEMIGMLNGLKALNINTVVFQARPAADAFYNSSIEPFSQWLMGEQGKRPDPFYDPLQFVIDEAHRRCMDVHVWLNPYRASMSEDEKVFSKDHAFYLKKHLMKKYGGRYYFDPGLKETREYFNQIVADIVTRYDVDGVHLDDYFYPYKVKNEAFPDNDSFKKEPRGFKKNKKDDWRRDNVNLVIAQLQHTIKSIKPWVEFGVSPFGIWRHDCQDKRGSATRCALTNYDDLYADILKWLQDGDIDYVVPQLYWEIGKPIADYKVLVDWWAKYSYNKNLYIGLYASGLGNSKISAWNNGNELARQLELNKKYPQQQGVLYFSARTLLKNPLGLADTLRNNYYKYPSLVPINSNIKGGASAQPLGLKIVKDDNNKILLSWDEVNGKKGKQVAYYVVYAFKGDEIGNIDDPQYIVSKTPDNEFDLSTYTKGLTGEYTFVVTSINRYKYESKVKESVIYNFE